jgi:gluconolactonase
MTEFRVVATGLRFPEGPIALGDGSVVLVEIARGTLTRVFPDGTVAVVAELGGGPNGAAIGPDGACYVCNNGGFEWHDVGGLLVPGETPASYRGGSIQRVDLRTGRFTTVYTHCGEHRLNGPNDLVFDASGGFWFSDNGKRRARDMDRGGIYYARPDGSAIHEWFFPFEHPNGVGLSPDERALYFNETVTGRCFRAELSAPGTPARTFNAFDPTACLYGAPGVQLFDSMAIEAGGNVCIATIINGGITVVAPDGRLVEHVPLPDPFVTNLCFGGPDRRTAYVTLSGTGQLIEMRWPRPGANVNFVDRALF